MKVVRWIGIVAFTIVLLASLALFVRAQDVDPQCHRPTPTCTAQPTPTATEPPEQEPTQTPRVEMTQTTYLPLVWGVLSWQVDPMAARTPAGD